MLNRDGSWQRLWMAYCHSCGTVKGDLMKRRQKLRIAADLVMILLLPVLMAYSLVGEAIHEYVGATMFALFLFHHALNVTWLKNLFKGKYSGVRMLNTAVNILLVVVMFVLPISGMIMSRHLLAFLNFGGGISFARSAHLFTSYWGYILMSLHLGLHWNAVMGVMKKRIQTQKASKARTMLLRIPIILISLYGVYTFIKRGIGPYLILQNTFTFFDFSEPRICFFCGLSFNDVSVCRRRILYGGIRA